MKRLKSAALLLPLLALSACTHHLSSAEQHAKHYVYQTRDDFDPQFRTDVNGSIKNAVPMFEQFLPAGEKGSRGGRGAQRGAEKGRLPGQRGVPAEHGTQNHFHQSRLQQRRQS
ncbi:Uncharacterised protein [Serratia marcescens]|uniref:Lipoprotein n=1 Tax=Serratia marcescens TaxID=615 RepID=A0A380ATT9_SERMA|nr:Uncharacterised protein [Serratia marcescens]